MRTLWSFFILWGVWILIPILIDGIETIYRFVLIIFFRKKALNFKLTDDELPRISIIVPAFNEERTVDRCLNSIKIQNYPHDKMEVIVVDDGSTDNTRSVVRNNINGKNGNGNGYSY